MPNMELAAPSRSSAPSAGMRATRCTRQDRHVESGSGTDQFDMALDTCSQSWWYATCHVPLLAVGHLSGSRAVTKGPSSMPPITSSESNLRAAGRLDVDDTGSPSRGKGSRGSPGTRGRPCERAFDGRRCRRIADMAYGIRRLSVEMIAWAQWGHIGGSFSMAELLAVLYFHHMSRAALRPTWEGRDRLILSKAHGSPGLYAALALARLLPGVGCLRLLRTGRSPGGAHGHAPHAWAGVLRRTAGHGPVRGGGSCPGPPIQARSTRARLLHPG